MNPKVFFSAGALYLLGNFKQMLTIFFTAPIMEYIMKGGENMNGGLSKSFKKMGTLDFGRNPPLLNLKHNKINIVPLDHIKSPSICKAK